MSSKLNPGNGLAGLTTPMRILADRLLNRWRPVNRDTRMAFQRTLRRSVHCAGIGLHSGRKVTIQLKPAPANSGIRFRRADLGGIDIPAHVAHLGSSQHLQTGPVRDQASVETIEHLLAALRGLCVDNVLIELNQAEVPIMDGSAAPWVYLIQDAGIKDLAASRKTIRILRQIQLQDGDKRIA